MVGNQPAHLPHTLRYIEYISIYNKYAGGLGFVLKIAYIGPFAAQEDQKYLQEDQEEFGQEDQAYYIQGNKNNNNMKDFEMFTDEGNRACTEAFENIYNIIFGDKFVPEAELKKIVKEQIAQVEENYEEVRDTEPEWHFENMINKVLEIRGYAYRVNRYDDF